MLVVFLLTYVDFLWVCIKASGKFKHSYKILIPERKAYI